MACIRISTKWALYLLCLLFHSFALSNEEKCRKHIESSRTNILISLLKNENPAVKLKITIAVSAGRLQEEDSLRVLEQLLEQLLKQKQKNWELEKAIAVSAGQIGGEGGLKIIEQIQALNPTHWEVQKAVVVSAGQIGGEGGLKIIEQIQALNPTHWEVQKAVAVSAGQIGGEGGLKVLEQLLEQLLKQKQKNWEVEQAIAVSAGQIGGEGGLKVLKRMQEALNPTHLAVKTAIAVSSMQIDGKIDSNIVKHVLDPNSAALQTAVIQLAKQIGGQAGLNLLQQLTSYKTNNQVKTDIAFAVGSIKEEEGEEILLKLMSQDNIDPALRQWVTYAAGNIGASSVIKIMQTALDQAVETSQEFIWAATSVIGFSSKEDQIAVLQDLINRQPNTTSLSIIVFITITKTNIEVFKTLFNQNPELNQNIEVQHIAAFAAGSSSMTENKGPEILQILLNQKNLSSRVKRVIAWAAGEIGGIEGANILQQLTAVQNSADPSVQEKIVRAAIKIGGKEGIEVLQLLLTQNLTNKLKTLIAELILSMERV